MDDDIAELEVRVSDGNSSFCNKVYGGHEDIRKIARDLDAFRLQVHGGIYDFKPGGFGPEYANGAFNARFHFFNGKLFVSTYQESAHFEFKHNKVVSTARLYLRVQPSDLDEFVVQWKHLGTGKLHEAKLRCIDL